jgi:hypothetical protein
MALQNNVQGHRKVTEDAPVRLCPRLTFACRASANTPAVPFDLSERGVERGMRPALYVRHGFKGVALRVDRELMGGVLPDGPHRATKQVCQAPDCASLRCDDNHIHVEPRGECAIVAIAAVSHGVRKPGIQQKLFAAEPLQLTRGELARPHGLQGARRTPGMIGEYRLGRLGPFAARRWQWRLQRHSSGGATAFLLSRDFMPVMVNQPIPHDGREANKKPRPIAGRGCVGLDTKLLCMYSCCRTGSTPRHPDTLSLSRSGIQ